MLSSRWSVHACRPQDRLLLICRPIAASSRIPSLAVTRPSVTGAILVQPQPGAGRQSGSPSMFSGNGQAGSPAAASAESIWTSPRRTAQAAMNAFNRTKHD